VVFATSRCRGMAPCSRRGQAARRARPTPVGEGAVEGRGARQAGRRTAGRTRRPVPPAPSASRPTPVTSDRRPVRGESRAAPTRSSPRRTAPSAARTRFVTAAPARAVRRAPSARQRKRVERGRSRARPARPSAPNPATSRTGPPAAHKWSVWRGSAAPAPTARPACPPIPAIKGH
jgi:hypothetical protein